MPHSSRASWRDLLRYRFENTLSRGPIAIIGWLAGGPGRAGRRTMALSTSLRNVGVGLVIVSGNFAGTPAVSAALAYGIVEVLGSLLVAFWWGSSTRRAEPSRQER